MMGISPLGISDDDNITIDYDEAVSNQGDMERSMESSHNSGRSRALEDSAPVSVKASLWTAPVCTKEGNQ